MLHLRVKVARSNCCIICIQCKSFFAFVGVIDPTAFSASLSSENGYMLCVTFNLVDDFILEGDRIATVAITDSSRAVLGFPSNATVIINGNDGKYR